MYQGHLPNGNPVQQHSAGDCYPFVISQKGLEPNDQYLVMYAGETFEIADTFNDTRKLLLRIKERFQLHNYIHVLRSYARVYRERIATKTAEAEFAARVNAPEPTNDALAIQVIFAGADEEEPTVRNIVYQYIEAGAFLEEEVADRMLKLSVHDNGMFLKDFRDDRFVFEIYSGVNTAGVVAQIMWRLQSDYVCNFAEWRGVVAAWLLHRGESVMNWQHLAFDTWQSAAYREVKSWQDLCALLNAVTSKD